MLDQFYKDVFQHVQAAQPQPTAAHEFGSTAAFNQGNPATKATPTPKQDSLTWLGVGTGLIPSPAPAPAPAPTSANGTPSAPAFPVQPQKPFEQGASNSAGAPISDYLSSFKNAAAYPTTKAAITKESFTGVKISDPAIAMEALMQPMNTSNWFAITDEQKAKLASGDYTPITEIIRQAVANSVLTSVQLMTAHINTQLPDVFGSAFSAQDSVASKQTLKDLVTSQYSDPQIAGLLFTVAQNYQSFDPSASPQKALSEAEKYVNSTQAALQPRPPQQPVADIL